LTTIYKILEDYSTANDITELLDSDILILPNKKKEDSFGKDQPLGLVDFNKDLKIKYYCNGKPYTRFEASADVFLDLGCMVFNLASFVASLITISNYIKKNHKYDNVKITIVHGNLNNNCQINVFEGNGSDVSKDILSLKDS
jgi:hypothetical protein